MAEIASRGELEMDRNDPWQVGEVRKALIKQAGERAKPWRWHTYPRDDEAGTSAVATAVGWLYGEFAVGCISGGRSAAGRPGLPTWSRGGSSRTGIGLSGRTPATSSTSQTVDGEPGAFDRVGQIWKASVAVLDDLGAERSTDWSLDVLAGIIEHRSANALPTIVTTNYKPSELARKLSGHDDPIVGERLDLPSPPGRGHPPPRPRRPPSLRERTAIVIDRSVTPAPSPFLTAEEVSARLRCSLRTVHELSRRNEIPLRRLPGTRRLLFPLIDIQAWEEGAPLEVIELPRGGRSVRAIREEQA